jgi:hypothetical protein
MAKKLNKMCEYFHTTNLYTCPQCKKELRNYMQELKAKIETIPKERKQLFLDYLKEGNVGQAVERIDPKKEFDCSVWFQIISDQITVHKYETFNFTAK